MLLIKKLILGGLLFFLCSAANAQIEVAKLSSKGFSPFGFGGFLNFASSVSESSAVTVEGGFYYFSQDDYHAAVVPVVIGYRQFITNQDYGWYVEPFGGYTFGATDIQKYDANGDALYKPNGNELDQKVAGPVGGAGFGYIFEPSGRIQFNIGIRAEHIFVTGGDPSLNIISLRISHSFSFGRRG